MEVLWEEIKTYEHQVLLVNDRVDRGEIDIIYCPAEEMLGDFHSKPLQGGLFRKFRNRIMNCELDYSMLAMKAK